jgi:sortase B
MKDRKGNVTKKGNKIKVFILNFLFLVFLALFIYCGIRLYKWEMENRASNKALEDAINLVDIEEDMGDTVEQVNPPTTDSTESDYLSDYYYYMSYPFLSVNFSELINKNSDTVGWIKVNGTDINYPIVQSDDNSYYLTHAFDKSYNPSGWIFADYRCDLENLRDNTIIYGHNRHSNILFGTLLNALNQEWCENKENRIIQLSTETKNSVWQVFSVYTIDKDANYLNVYFKNKEEHLNYLNEMKNKSIYDFNTPITTDDKILTLSTCTMDSNGRVVVQAKLIKTTNK